MSEQSVWKLIEAFGRLLEKSGGPAKTHNVIVDRLSIGNRMTQLLDRIEVGQGSFRFESCFDLELPEAELRHQVVVTLLAVLELAKLKVIRVLQSPDAETLFITQAGGVSMEAARKAARSAVSSDSTPPEPAAAESQPEETDAAQAQAVDLPVDVSQAIEAQPDEAQAVDARPDEAQSDDERPAEEKNEQTQE